MSPWRSSSKQSIAELTRAQTVNKHNILSSVTESVSELQYQYKNSGDLLPSNDITTRLCTALEACFIHGLKETFLGRLSSRLHDSGVSSPRLPEPSFWTFALVFSHKEVISQLESLTQVNTDVGRSRAWLRLALNDGLLLSYLSTMIADKVSLSVHYEKYAFLRDSEKRDLCLSYLTGISVFSFSLSTNVSTLNKWQTRPLVIAGAWRDSKVEIDIGADVAAEIVEEVEESADHNPEFVRSLAEPIEDAPGLGYMRRGLLNEDEALRLILASTPVAFSPQTESMLDSSNTDTAAEVADAAVTTPSEDNVSRNDLFHYTDDDQTEDEMMKKSPSPELILSRSATVSPTLEWDNPAVEDTDQDHDMMVSSPCLAEEIETATVAMDDVRNADDKVDSPDQETCLTPPSRCQSPLSNTSSLSLDGNRSPPPRLNLVLREEVHQTSNTPGDLISEQNTRQRRLVGMGFSSPPSIRVTALSLAQNISLTSCLDLICHESGLDSQDWRCHDCSKSIGALFGKPRLCEFTKKYYCDDCHNNIDTSVIPARIMYNWDATPYKVSKTSKLFLQSISTKPMINAATFSPNLSRIAPVLENSHRLRKQLIYLSAYLSACSKANQEGVKVALAETVWPREYLYTETDTYSIKDMVQLHSGDLINTLSTAVSLCIKHVSGCVICSGRGFICEVCRDRRPVYPFNLDTTSQCRECQTVFHSHCSKNLVTCPRCERIETRNLQWHVNNSKLTREMGEQHDM